MTKWTRTVRVVNKLQDPTIVVSWESDNGILLVEFFGDIYVMYNDSDFKEGMLAHLVAKELFSKLEESYQREQQDREEEPRGYYQ